MTTPDPLYATLLIIGYAVIGGGIKYVDKTYDENGPHKTIALGLALLSGLMIAYLSAVDTSSATIFIAIILGAAVTKKINNQAFYAGLSIVLAVMGYRYFTNALTLDWIPLMLLTLSATADEAGNDLADKGKIRGFLGTIFRNRGIMKVAVLLAALLGLLHWVYFITFMAFDITYHVVDRY